MADKEISLKINIEGISSEASELAKLEMQMKNLNEERTKFLKKATEKGHLVSNEDRLILAAYDRDLKQTNESIKNLKKVVDTADDSLNRMRAELIRMKNEYAGASEVIRNKMAPEILALNNKVLNAEKAIGVFGRNVGNYPQIMQTAAGGVNQLTSAIGGATGVVGEAVTSFATAGGAAGIFAVAMGTVAAVWKRVQENIELYLKSADKLQYSFAGYERDTEKALEDYRKRLRGQEAAGIEAAMAARSLLNTRAHEYTEEQRESLRIQIAEGERMREQAREQLNILRMEEDRGRWKIEYNRLLQEEEKLNDKKLENETRWEGIEAELVKQRAIVSDQESSIAEKKAASVKADELSQILLSEKLAAIDLEIENVNAIAEATATQEVVEERINSLLRERKSIQKEYYSDQVRINRLERTAGRGESAGTAGGNPDAFEEKMRKERERQGEIEMKRLEDEYKAEQDARRKELEALAAFNKLGEQANQERLDREAEQNKKAYDQEVEAYKKKEDLKRQALNESFTLASNALNAFANLFEVAKQRELSAVGDNAKMREDIEKKYAQKQQRIAIGQALINGALAISDIWSKYAAIPVLAAILTAVAAAVSVAQISTIKAQKFATGGRIVGGLQVHPDTSKDNTLIYVKQNEAVINERQIAALGGTRAMQAARVPGFAEGGAVGSMPYINPSMPAQEATMAGLSDRIANLEIHLDMHKVRSASRELDVTLEHQRI